MQERREKEEVNTNESGRDRIADNEARAIRTGKESRYPNGLVLLLIFYLKAMQQDRRI